ncbi:MAG TPA: MarR family transcriptional regulator [Solirubrobacteraceae bacterium]|nr:MarR family transcriptional regulator [Solirubrobacteraceae bacterium]
MAKSSRPGDALTAAQLGHVIARLARQVEVAAATVDLTLSQYRALALLGEGREAASALAEKLAVSRPSVTGVIDGLVARELVTRHHDEGDRRRIGLDLTSEGRRLLATADAEIERRLRDIASYQPDGAAAAFEGLEPWKDALDRYRAARRAGAPRAGTRPQGAAA